MSLGCGFLRRSHRVAGGQQEGRHQPLEQVARELVVTFRMTLTQRVLFCHSSAAEGCSPQHSPVLMALPLPEGLYGSVLTDVRRGCPSRFSFCLSEAS